MFIVMFDDNAMVCETRKEALEIVESLTLDGYKYITVGHNAPLDIENINYVDVEV